jgi:hypothetical protein
MNTALRAKWAWNLRAEEKNSWSTLPGVVDEEIRQIFNAAARVVAGKGDIVFSGWING